MDHGYKEVESKIGRCHLLNNIPEYRQMEKMPRITPNSRAEKVNKISFIMMTWAYDGHI